MKTIFISSLKPLHFVSTPNSKDLAYYFSLTQAPEFLQSHEDLLLELPQLVEVDFSSFEGKNIFEHPIFDDPKLKITWEYLPNCNLHQKMVATFEDVAFLALFFGLCYLSYRDFNVSEPNVHFASSRK